MVAGDFVTATDRRLSADIQGSRPSSASTYSPVGSSTGALLAAVSRALAASDSAVASASSAASTASDAHRLAGSLVPFGVFLFRLIQINAWAWRCDRLSNLGVGGEGLQDGTRGRLLVVET